MKMPPTPGRFDVPASPSAPFDVCCRFEDRLAGSALSLHAPCARITAGSPEALDAAFADIESARRNGKWIALLLDYALGEWLDPALADAPMPAGAAPRLTAWVFDRAERGPVWPPPAQQAPCRLTHAPQIDPAHYRRTVDLLRDHMARGDFYQANYTFPMRLETDADLETLYRRQAHAHPSAHAVYFRDDRRSILSFSPELFVARSGARLTVRPMKGTAPRHADPVQDQASADALLASTKNRAENLMIVDLLRNDLGRLAVPGSVKVDALFSLERYPSVWTLTSTISADVPDLRLQEMLTALFPCGSITGAPKIAAMRRLREIEPHPRGIYCGSLGWLAPDGDFSLNVAIRTMEFLHADRRKTASGMPVHRGTFGVGGGIVYDSDAAQEWEECLWKARILASEPGSGECGKPRGPSHAP